MEPRAEMEHRPMPERTTQGSRKPAAEVKGKTKTNRKWKEEAVMATKNDSPLGPKQKRLVQESFAKVEPIAEAAAALFYDKLFELDPGLKTLFKTDIKEQGRKLMATLKLAVKGLDDLEKLVPVVQDLGRRHAGYGVQSAHYGTVAEALLWALEQGLKDDFTPEVKEAWTAVYALLAETMVEAA
jgi:hemoglobin-like flavoprotein